MSSVVGPQTVFSGATTNGQSIDTAMIFCRGARKVAFRVSAPVADAGKMIAVGAPSAQRFGQLPDGSDAKTDDLAGQLAPPDAERGLLAAAVDPGVAGIWFTVVPRNAATGDPGMAPDYVGLTLSTDAAAGAFTALKVEASVHY